jgi:hypothetical protein
VDAAKISALIRQELTAKAAKTPKRIRLKKRANPLSQSKERTASKK